MHVLLWQSFIPSFPDFHGNNLFFPHLSKARTEKASITFHSFLSKLSKHYRSLQHEHPMKEKGKALLTEDIVIFSTPTQTFLKFTILKNYNPQTAQAAHSVILISINPLSDIINPLRDIVNPFRDIVNPFSDIVNPFTDIINPFRVIIHIKQRSQSNLKTHKQLQYIYECGLLGPDKTMCNFQHLILASHTCTFQDPFKES